MPTTRLLIIHFPILDRQVPADGPCAVGCVVGGLVTDGLIRRMPRRRWARALPAIAGFVLASLCYWACLHFFTTRQVVLFALFLALAGFFNDLTMSPAWATCQDIGRRHAAIVAGCMNTIGNLGGAVSSYVIGELLFRSRQAYAPAGADFAKLAADQKAAALLPGYEWNFYSFAAMYAVAVVLWLCIDATKPVFAEDAAPGPPA